MAGAREFVPTLSRKLYGNKAFSFSAVAAYLDRNIRQSAVHVKATVLTVTTLRYFFFTATSDSIVTRADKQAARLKYK